MDTPPSSSKDDQRIGVALERILALVAGTAAAGDPASDPLFAPDVQVWQASPDEGLRAAVASVDGPAPAAHALSRLAPSALTLIATVSSADAAWTEAIRSNGAKETCVAGLTYDATGAVSRVVWLRAPLVPCELKDRPGAPDARPIVEAYFDDLMHSRFREAAARFTPDTLYSHPPYAGGTERVLFHGRDALWRGLVTERGESPVRQVLTGLWQRRGRVFVEGVIEGIPDGGTFFATAQISSRGEIARYVAFYCGRRIPNPNSRA